MMVALLTYHRTDPGWSYTGNGQLPQNAAGYVGAWLADCFLSLFGYAAYLFPLMLLYAAWHAYEKRAALPSASTYALLLLRVLGFTLVFLSVTGLLHLYVKANAAYLPYLPGGLLGAWVAHALVHTFNVWGATWVMVMNVMLGMTFYTGCSWVHVFSWMGSCLAQAGGVSWRRWQNRERSLMLTPRLAGWLKRVFTRQARMPSVASVPAAPLASTPSFAVQADPVMQSPEPMAPPVSPAPPQARSI